MSSSRARVKVKETPVTRAQAAAEFGRKKAKLRRKQWNRRAFMAGGAVLLVYVVVVSWMHMRNGRLEEAANHWSESFWLRTAGLGFRLDQVTLEGREHADAAAIRQALGIVQGAPILAVSLAEMKTRLEAVPEVKSVGITRVLPNQLAITIHERNPAAWWQQGGEQQLIDAEGVVLARSKYSDTLSLPVVVGEDAPKHVGELLALLNAAPGLKPDVVAAVRVGQRRWNVQLTREVVVMLPEENPVAAWKRFADLAEKDALLSKAIRSVDMRVEDRVFIMPIEQKQSPITLTTARET